MKCSLPKCRRVAVPEIGVCEKHAYTAAIAHDVLTGKDDVNSPSHYNRGGIETIALIDAFELDFYEGNIVKYILRSKFKGQQLKDLKKAQWYLTRKIALMEKAHG